MIKFIFSIKPWLRYTLSFIYLLILVLLSLLPTSDFPDVPFFSGEDKYIHICMYLGLGFLACWSLDFRGKERIPSVILLIAGVAMWGILMEVLQRLMTNGRGMEVMDMFANLAGAIAGMVLYRILDRKRVIIKI